MKKYVYCLGLLFLSFSVHAYRINLHIKGMNNSKVYLGYYYGGGAYLADSTNFENEKAVFSRDTQILEGLYFIYNVNFQFDFLLPQQEITIESQVPDVAQNLKFVDKDALRFHQFKTYLNKAQQDYKDIAEKLQNAQDPLQKQELEKQLNGLENQIHEHQSKVIAESPEAFSSKMIALMLKPKAQPLKYKVREKYFDKVDFNDIRFIRTPYLFNMIQNFVDFWCEPHPDSIAIAADKVIAKAEAANPVYFQFFLNTIAQRYGDPKSLGEVLLFQHFVEKYYLSGKANWLDEQMLAAIRAKLEEVRPKSLLNKTAPDITLLDSAYQIVNLQDIQADYLVVYFYDPQCGHCKEVTPKLYAWYKEKKKKKNVKVFAVCTSTDIKAWKAYVRTDIPEWIHGIDFAGASKFLAAYNVRNTPKIFLLDAGKTVIGEDLDMDKLMQMIK